MSVRGSPFRANAVRSGMLAASRIRVVTGWGSNGMILEKEDMMGATRGSNTSNVRCFSLHAAKAWHYRMKSTLTIPASVREHGVDPFR